MANQSVETGRHVYIKVYVMPDLHGRVRQRVNPTYRKTVGAEVFFSFHLTQLGSFIQAGYRSARGVDRRVEKGFCMLGKFTKRIAYKIRRKLNYKTISISGIVLNTDPEFVPKGIRKQLLQKDYETPELKLVRLGITSQDRVLEVGAGIGFLGIACAKICGQDNILSYEPNPKMKPVIEANYSLNGMRPNLRSKVVAVTSGEFEFFFSEHVLSSSLVDRKQGTPTLVEADAISGVVDEFRPTAIIMDAEGAEIDLLPNCDLANVSTIAVEMHAHIVGATAISELRTYLIERGFVEIERLGKTALFKKAD